MTAATKPSVDHEGQLAYTRRELAKKTGFSVEFIKKQHHAGALRAKETSPGSSRYRYLAGDVTEWLESLPDG